MRARYCDILVESLKFCQKEKGLELYAWCIMPSHLHLIIGTVNKPMQGILRDLKSYTSRKLKEETGQYSGESRRDWLMGMMQRANYSGGNGMLEISFIQ